MQITQTEEQTERQMKKKKKERKQHIRSMGLYKTCQPMHNRGSRRRREREGDQKMYLKKLWLKTPQT